VNETRPRILGYDLARALATFGMVLVNFTIVLCGPEPEPGLLAMVEGLFQGRASAVFVVSAGIGLSLLSARAVASGDRARIGSIQRLIAKRGLFLLVVGFLYTPLWPADILHFYGIYLMVGALLIAVPDRVLWATAAALIIAFAIMLLPLGYFGDWDWETLTYRDFWSPTGLVKNLFFNGFHPVIPWTAFLLAGMWLGRLDLRRPAPRRRLLALSLTVAAATHLASHLLVRGLSAGAGSEEAEEIALLLGTGVIPPLPLYMLSAGATAIAVIVSSVEIAERFAASRWLDALCKTGELTLTHYVAHVVLGMGIMEAAGLIGKGDIQTAWLAAILFFSAAVAFSTVWRSRFSRGPLEWLMRKITG